LRSRPEQPWVEDEGYDGDGSDASGLTLGGCAPINLCKRLRDE